MELKTTMKCSPLDYELSELLGEKSMDFVVVLANGEQLEFFGTPIKSQRSLEIYAEIVRSLNDRTKKSEWPTFFKEWNRQFIKQFKLAEGTTSKEYHPKFTLGVSRVCHGHSSYLHCAIQLFEKLDDRIKSWVIRKLPFGKSLVEITPVDGPIITQSGDVMSIVIGEAVKRLLSSQNANGDARRDPPSPLSD